MCVLGSRYIIDNRNYVEKQSIEGFKELNINISGRVDY